MKIQSHLEQSLGELKTKWFSYTESKSHLFARVPILKTLEKLHVVFTPEEIEQELENLEEHFPDGCFPIAVDLGANYFVLTPDSEVTYWDYTGFYSKPEGPNVYPVSSNLHHFVYHLEECSDVPTGSRTSYLLQAHKQVDTAKDSIWHFAGKKLQCIERRTFITFFISKYLIDNRD